jgi:hypothetical protein
MLSPHIYAALVQERHQGFLAQAETDRRNRRARARRPRNGAALLADGFARLSDRYRRWRFLSPKPALSPVELGYFTDVDQHDHEALGALEYELTPGPAE